MVRTSSVKAFVSGVHNLVDKELAPKDASTQSLGWLTKDGRIELMYGRQALGDAGSAGKVVTQHTAYKVDGTAVKFRKIWDGTEGKIQYLNGSTWTDVIIGLDRNPCSFSNYSSLSGNAVYVTSPTDGLFKIMAANPATYTTLYDETRNFKGYSFIDKGRMILYGTVKDPTGLYGSWIDAQDGDVYTTVTAEPTTSLSGTLAFKAGDSKRTCFGIEITLTATGEVYTDDYNGNLTGSLGGTGTINYMTGAYTLSNAGVGTADYQWENSNVKGVTDFTKSATRLAGEGFTVRQDIGGDAIQVVLPLEGSYFSIKERSVYQFTLDAEDTNPTNQVIRTNIGVSTQRAAVGTGVGIVFIDTGNPTKPKMVILEKNPFGDNFTTTELFPHFDFSQYQYDDTAIDSWDTFIVVACKSGQTDENDILLLCDVTQKTVDISNYGASCFAKDGGYLYAGDPVTTTTYELFTGFDDMGAPLSNYWIGSFDTLGTDTLKKVKRHRFTGKIVPDQALRVYVGLDNSSWQLIGTILGTGDYVDYSSTAAIGTTYVGQGQVGGEGQTLVYPFLIELKVKLSKFRGRQIKFEATGIGYVSIQSITDYDIWTYQDKIPATYRVKQNVSLDGETTDMDSPQY